MSPLALIALLLVAFVLVAIYVLARQDTAGTEHLAWRTEQLLARLFPPTGTGEIGEPTWLGLTIRRLAHIVEYALLAAVVIVAALVLVGPDGKAVAVAGIFCFAASLADELHKTRVPGRHFDTQDLVLDAFGYGAILLVGALFLVA